MGKKECYGILDNVFPFGKEGLRQVPPECFECHDRLPCLKAAIDTKEGYGMRSDNLQKVPSKSLLDKVKRWSQKKELSRLENGKGKK